jgi:tRNA pseudouridine38-40 synthase
MDQRTIQLVLQYDGAGFAGWQRQPGPRTVQGELEAGMSRLLATPTGVVGAGRTDAGVHARGQAVGVTVPDKWSATSLRRALNAVVPPDMWVATAHEMSPEFHARYSATARRYSYRVGTDDAARSPFRRRWEHQVLQPIDPEALAATTAQLLGEHRFLAFAVRGTAPATDDHRCTIQHAAWVPVEGGWRFDIQANRFLHHMVRFLVGTMLQIATGQRPLADFGRLLVADANDEISPPAPAHALCLEAVEYPAPLYRTAA